MTTTDYNSTADSVPRAGSETTSPAPTTTTQAPTITTISSIATTPLKTGLGEKELILAISVPVGVIAFICGVLAAIICYRRRRNKFKRKGRVPYKGPDQQIIQTERDRPGLDLPLSTYEEPNSSVNSPTYHNYTGLNPGTALKDDPRLRKNSQDELYENTEPQSIVPQSESKQILVPKGWSPQLVKPSSPRHKPPSPKPKPSPPVLKPLTPRLKPSTSKDQRNQQAPHTSPIPKPKNPQRQESAENPYYITVRADPSPAQLTAYNKNQGQKKHQATKLKRNQKHSSMPKQQAPGRPESTMSNNYYNLNDDNSYQNVALKLNK